MLRHNKYNTALKHKRAFTLVELLVVLVILAVLAALLVPALTGYIKEARRGKYYDTAHYALTAAQAVMDEVYARGIDPNSIETTNANGGGANGDVRWDYSGTTWTNGYEMGNRVLQLMDRDRSNAPYLFIFGVRKSSTDVLSNYQVCFVAYVESSNTPAVFYVNGVWTYKYPWEDPGRLISTNNTIVSGNIPMRLYVVSNRTGNRNNFWTLNQGNHSLQAHSEGHNGY